MLSKQVEATRAGVDFQSAMLNKKLKFCCTASMTLSTALGNIIFLYSQMLILLSISIHCFSPNPLLISIISEMAGVTSGEVLTYTNGSIDVMNKGCFWEFNCIACVR
jgi:hypothetical protein